jgi:hypothetical protein
MRRLPLTAATLTLLAQLVLTAPAVALDCRAAAAQEIERLGLTEAEIAQTRYVQQYNPGKKGPDVLGVRAWLRLKGCPSGHLVIDMTRSCFVRQSYTRGDCRLDGVTAY